MNNERIARKLIDLAKSITDEREFVAADTVTLGGHKWKSFDKGETYIIQGKYKDALMLELEDWPEPGEVIITINSLEDSVDEWITDLLDKAGVEYTDSELDNRMITKHWEKPVMNAIKKDIKKQWPRRKIDIN